MDWLAKAIGLPDDFLHSKTQSHGGGVIQTTASESTFVCLLAGRTEAIRRYQTHFPDAADAEINSRLVAYCSDQAHSSVEKAGLVGLVKIRYVESDEHFSLRGNKLKEAIEFDKKNGLIPFFVRHSMFLVLSRGDKYFLEKRSKFFVNNISFKRTIVRTMFLSFAWGCIATVTNFS